MDGSEELTEDCKESVTGKGEDTFTSELVEEPMSLVDEISFGIEEIKLGVVDATLEEDLVRTVASVKLSNVDNVTKEVKCTLLDLSIVAVMGVIVGIEDKVMNDVSDSS